MFRCLLAICKHRNCIYIGREGHTIRPARILLVATHADCMLPGDDAPDITSTVLLESVRHKFSLNFDLYPKAFAVNALEAMSADMKVLRGILADLKSSICPVGLTVCFIVQIPCLYR